MTYVYVTRPDNKGERYIIKQPKPIPPVTQELLKLTYLPQKREEFEHDGIMITDRTKSPCGRFDLTDEESDKLYGNA